MHNNNDDDNGENVANNCIFNDVPKSDENKKKAEPGKREEKNGKRDAICVVAAFNWISMSGFRMQIFIACTHAHALCTYVSVAVFL